MTEYRIALRALLEKGSDEDLLAERVALVTNRLMQLDVENRCNAAPHERNEQRQNHRNGYRARSWETRAGTVELKVLKLCRWSIFVGNFRTLQRT